MSWPADGRLAGKTALVTGASRGIGAAIARRLAAEGAAVALVYREREQAAAAVQATIAAAGGRAVLCQADLIRIEECSRAVTQTAAALGGPDILVHGAGISRYGLVGETSPAAWDELFAIHARAPFFLAQAALPAMLRSGWGRIVIISSIWGLVGAANEVAYSAAKAAQLGLVKALAKEVALAGITVNAVAPGAVQTEMLATLSAPEVADFAAQVPMGRLGTPEEVAAAVAFLASPECSYLSGQVISPNGVMVV